MASPSPKTGIRLDAAAKELFARLKALAGKGTLYQEILRFFHGEGGKIGGRIQHGFESGEFGIRRRTGALARGIVGMGVKVNGLPAVQVGVIKGPSLQYAGVQEYGTVGKGGKYPTIRPKKGKALAIPVNKTLTKAGVARYDGPKSDPRKLTFIPSKQLGGNGPIGALYDDVEMRKIARARKKAEEWLGGFKAAWILVKKVDIRPKRFLRKTFYSSLPELSRNLAAFIKQLMLRYQPPAGAGGRA